MIPYIFFAPIQGITNSEFINTYDTFFGEDIYKYFTPFMRMESYENKIRKKDLKNIHTININIKQKVIPQIVSNNYDDLVNFASQLSEEGFNEINLNLGCPFPMLVKRKLGGGLLGDLNLITALLDQFFSSSASTVDLSIKTRIGLESPDEIFKIIEIFNQFPLKYIIIHPRTVMQQYSEIPYKEIFYECIKISKIPLIYNGDILTKDDYDQIINSFSNNYERKIMIGRRILKNLFLPAIINENFRFTSGSEIALKIQNFLSELLEQYRQRLSGDKNIILKMLQYWEYFSVMFNNNSSKVYKTIKKSRNLNHYIENVNKIFKEYELKFLMI
ncbi:MAG: tRNA-dihydrouridine synthase family protein [Flavobacterium piscis]|nr:tRNA-dihydrouridine synthase family protein [Flavobacterium piscis]